jgi:hypothetical protein
MSVAMGVFFLAILAGVVFLLLLIFAFVIRRRAKRRAAESRRPFSAVRSQFVDNDSLDEVENRTDHTFSESTNNAGPVHPMFFWNDPVQSGGTFDSGAADSGAAASMSFETASEGGGFASSGPDHSSSTSYDSSSSSDSFSSSSWD